MKRLTRRNKDGFAYLAEKDNDGFFDEDEEEYNAINRLAELEDKLESGKLVELPCKVGDIIFVPYVYNGVGGIMKLPVDGIQIAKHSIVFLTDFETDDEIFAIKYNYGLFILGTFDDIWFTEKSEAEARLKELQEQNNG